MPWEQHWQQAYGVVVAATPNAHTGRAWPEATCSTSLPTPCGRPGAEQDQTGRHDAHQEQSSSRFQAADDHGEGSTFSGAVAGE